MLSQNFFECCFFARLDFQDVVLFAVARLLQERRRTGKACLGRMERLNVFMPLNPLAASGRSNSSDLIDGRILWCRCSILSLLLLLEAQL
mmetsp:Transcript_2299/g.8313  ORF Transcript_2299/g.8313 Transcript_2299/m.8313 type:complete len:90 (-) Transcript_2299:369-638(-)